MFLIAFDIHYESNVITDKDGSPFSRLELSQYLQVSVNVTTLQNKQ